MSKKFAKLVADGLMERDLKKPQGFVVAEREGHIFLLRRTFQAKTFFKDSIERAALNEDVLTSEYMPSQKYLVRRPALMSDGKPNPAQCWHDNTFKTKTEAETFFNTVKP